MQLLSRPTAAPAAISWDDAPCPLCGAPDAPVEREAADATPLAGTPPRTFAVVRCRECDLAYTNPRPAADAIGDFYPDDYRPHRRPRKLREAGRTTSAWGRWTGRRHPEREGDLPWVGRGRLLDFGCGGGSYLKRMPTAAGASPGSTRPSARCGACRANSAYTRSPVPCRTPT
jgi:hypothetical protein